MFWFSFPKTNNRNKNPFLRQTGILNYIFPVVYFVWWSLQNYTHWYLMIARASCRWYSTVFITVRVSMRMIEHCCNCMPIHKCIWTKNKYCMRFVNRSTIAFLLATYLGTGSSPIIPLLDESIGMPKVSRGWQSSKKVESERLWLL